MRSLGNRRERRSGTLLILSLLTFLACDARAVRAQEEPPAQPLTLRQALRRALEANASTSTARSQIATSEAQVRQLRTSILPHVDLDTAYTRNSSEVAFDANGFRAIILPRNDWSARINFSQPIYAGQRELKAIRQGRLAVSGAEAGLRTAEDAVLLSTASNYLAIVQGEALVKVEQGNLELAQRRRKQAQAFYEAGEQTKVDVLRAETDQKAAERALAAAQQSRDLAASRLRLDLALDEPAGAAVKVQSPDLAFPALPAPEALVAQAEANRPSVKQADLRYQIAQLETSKQRAARLPTIRAEGDVLRQRTSFPADQSAALTIRLTMPIFDSGEISAKVLVAREQERQAKIALDEAKRQVREDVLQSLLDLQTVEKDLALAKEQLAAAEAEYGQSFELYRAQETTSLDLQSSEAALAAARRAVVNGTVNRDLAELNVWSAAGTLKNLILSEGSAQ